MEIEKKKSKNLWSLIFLIINVGILYYLVVTDEQLRGSVSGIEQFNIYILSIALIFMIVYILIDVVKIYSLIKFYTGKKMFLTSVKVSVLGKYYDGITPFASGGQPFQIYVMTKADISGAHSGGVILMKYFIYQMVFCVFGVFCLIFNYFAKISVQPLYYIFAFIAILINFAMPFAIYILASNKSATNSIFHFFVNIGVKLRIVKDKEKLHEKMTSLASRFADSFALLKKDRKKLFSLSLLTLLEILLFILIPFIIYISYKPSVIYSSDFLYTLIKFTSMYLFVYFVMSIFPLPGGSGAAEFGFKWMLSSYFLNGTVSIAIIIWRVITYYFPLLLGLLTVIKDTAKKFRKT